MCVLTVRSTSVFNSGHVFGHDVIHRVHLFIRRRDNVVVRQNRVIARMNIIHGLVRIIFSSNGFVLRVPLFLLRFHFQVCIQMLLENMSGERFLGVGSEVARVAPVVSFAGVRALVQVQKRLVREHLGTSVALGQVDGANFHGLVVLQNDGLEFKLRVIFHAMDDDIGPAPFPVLAHGAQERLRLGMVFEFVRL